MRIWTRKSALIQPRTGLGKSDLSWPTDRLGRCPLQLDMRAEITGLSNAVELYDHEGG